MQVKRLSTQWNREDRVGRAEAEETHEHLAALVGATLEIFHLLDAFIAVHLIEFLVESLVFGDQVLGDILLAGLIVVAVEVHCVTF